MKNIFALSLLVAVALTTTAMAKGKKETRKPASDLEQSYKGCEEAGVYFSIPSEKQITKKECMAMKGQLCSASDQAMGGRWSSELVCYKGDQQVGGIKGTYDQGQIHRDEDGNVKDE